MRTWLMTAAGISALATGATAQAQTLRVALVKTHASNPTIVAQRRLVEAVAEEISIAESGRRPQLRASTGLNQDLISTSHIGRNYSASIDLEWPLFDGGQTSNRVASAGAQLNSARAVLQSVEGDVFTETVSVYLEVIRARAAALLQANQVVILESTLEATQELYSAGDLTLTDVSQAEARLAFARGELARTQAHLLGAEQFYLRVVGEAPSELHSPTPLLGLPATAEDAERLALTNNPQLEAAAQQVRASAFLIDSIRGERFPRISAVAGGRYVNFLGTADKVFAPGARNAQGAVGIGFTAVIPLSQGGSVSARVRESQAQRSRQLEQLIAIEREIVARARSSFATYRAALEAIRASEAAVAANTVALAGTREEFRIGARVILDILNAEQELLNSRFALLTAERDAYLAGFSLLNAMGFATSGALDIEASPQINQDHTLLTVEDFPTTRRSHPFRKPVGASSDATPSPSPMHRLGSPQSQSVETPSRNRQPSAKPEPKAPAEQLIKELSGGRTQTPSRDEATSEPPSRFPGQQHKSVAKPVETVQEKTSLQIEQAAVIGSADCDPPAEAAALASLLKVIEIPSTTGLPFDSERDAEAQHTPEAPSVVLPNAQNSRETADETSNVASNAAGRCSQVPNQVQGSGPKRTTKATRRMTARPPEGFVVQVAAYRSAAEAMQGWRRLKTRLGLVEFSPLATTITLPDRGAFHRLSVGGFASRDDAKRACDAIKKQGGECFVRIAAGDLPLA